VQCFGCGQVWDLRQTRSPLKAFKDLPNSYAQTTVSFSPDERLILTGTSTEKEGNAGGLLVFFDKERLELVCRVGVSANHSVVCSVWHPRLNQVCSHPNVSCHPYYVCSVRF
jgi:hypothetical protein